MKKGILLLLLALSLTLNVSAQYKEFQFGLMFQPGFNLSTISGDNISNADNGFSYKYGLSGAFYFGENYGFSSGVIFRSNGASYDFCHSSGDGDYNYRHEYRNTYLQVPVALKMRTDLINQKTRILGEFGMGFNFLVDNEDTYSVVGQSSHYDVKYRKFGTSLLIGAGVDVLIFKESSLVFQLVYDKSLSDMFKDTRDYPSMKMSNLFLEIGFSF